MAVTYKVKTKNLGDDRLSIRRAISHMHTSCNSLGEYTIGKSKDNMGWSFFDLSIDDSFQVAISEKFANMIEKYRSKDNQKLDSFIVDYITSKGCTAKISRLD